MRILMVTAGSRGDVAPFTGLGHRLHQAGHDVTVAAHERFAALVSDAGLAHHTLPGDPVDLVRARTAAPSPAAAQAVFAAFLDELGAGILTATTAGTDVLLTAFGPAPLSRLVAAGLGIPSIGVYLAPGVPTGAFAPPGWPTTGPASAAENLAAGRELLRRSSAIYADALHHLQARLDLPTTGRAPGRLHQPTDVGETAGRFDLGAVAGEAAEPPLDWPVCHGFSPAVVPRPADWPENVHVTGYWWPAGAPGWQPPTALTDFLEAGPPPVFIGFGSMTPERDRLREIVTGAVARAGVRAVVQAGWAELDATGDDILAVGDVPHDWLFPRMAAVVHHAGAGTAGAGLRAGVPAVCVPVLVDQPFWAARLHHLGVSPPPLPMSELTAGSLSDAMRACLDHPSYRDRARELAERIRAEDGAGAVLAVVERLVPGRS